MVWSVEVLRPQKMNCISNNIIFYGLLSIKPRADIALQNRSVLYNVGFDFSKESICVTSKYAQSVILFVIGRKTFFSVLTQHIHAK